MPPHIGIHERAQCLNLIAMVAGIIQTHLRQFVAHPQALVCLRHLGMGEDHILGGELVFCNRHAAL